MAWSPTPTILFHLLVDLLALASFLSGNLAAVIRTIRAGPPWTNGAPSTSPCPEGSSPPLQSRVPVTPAASTSMTAVRVLIYSPIGTTQQHTTSRCRLQWPLGLPTSLARHLRSQTLLVLLAPWSDTQLRF
ncbi:hypothetical protein BDW59DRAFT_143127 [Aspergillus cavernicola]|uniref:Secreted protein n=1 Tax=Aspergillus cavernicola TaxID=176166 RepID=A0ABR4IL56_9EURO